MALLRISALQIRARSVAVRTMRAILGLPRRRAREASVPDGRSGAVAIQQRFRGALTLNVHL